MSWAGEPSHVITVAVTGRNTASGTGGIWPVTMRESCLATTKALWPPKGRSGIMGTPASCKISRCVWILRGIVIYGIMTSQRMLDAVGRAPAVGLRNCHRASRQRLCSDTHVSASMGGGRRCSVRAIVIGSLHDDGWERGEALGSRPDGSIGKRREP